MKPKFAGLIVFAGLMTLLLPARADSFGFASSLLNYNGGSTGGIGVTKDFCIGAHCVTASGFLTSGTATSLSQKSISGDMGLGIYNPYPTGHNEIQTNDEVRLDLHDLSALTLGLSSLSGDSYVVWASNSSNCFSSTVTATSCAKVRIAGTASVTQPFALTGFGGYRYLYISATQGDVLVNTLTTTVPEPGSMVMLAGGLLGLAGIRRKLLR